MEATLAQPPTPAVLPEVVKDLVVPITNTAGDSNALAAAIAIAGRHNVHLSALEIVNLPVPATSPWGLMPGLATSEVYNTLRAKAERNAAAWRAVVRRIDIVRGPHDRVA